MFVDGADSNVLAQAALWAAEGTGVVLATVAGAWGSAPRGIGSHMAIAGNGAFAGSVSGGCVEAAVIEAAEGMLAGGPAVRRLPFGVADETAWSVGLPCGGSIDIVLATVGPSLLVPLQAARSAGNPVALRIDVIDQSVTLADEADGDLAPTIRRAWSGLINDRVFVRSYGPTARLLIVGAVHMAQSLARAARDVGFAVTIIDPRRRFADPRRFPDVALCPAWPDEVLRTQPMTADSALCALSHEARIDDPALLAALASPAFYIGALGSRRSHQARLERLAAAGVAPDQLARIRGPIGLAIGAQGPAEIAIATMAEIIAAYRRPPDAQPADGARDSVARR